MLTSDKTKTLNGVKINEYFLHNHNPNRINLPPKRTKQLEFITIHNTDDLPRVEDDAEQYTRSTQNGNMGTVVPDYYLDDLGGWQLLDGTYNNWTNTDGSGPGNTTSISIECIMTNKNEDADVKARDNCARLVAYLLHKYGLKEDAVVTHTYWLHVRDKHTSVVDVANRDKWCTIPHSYKTCPLYIIPSWKEFKQLVAYYYRQLKGYTPPADGLITEQKPPVYNDKPFLVKIVCNELNVRKEPGIFSDVVTIVTKNYRYTIVDTKYVGTTPWGKLKSGAGWISLLPKYVEKV